VSIEEVPWRAAPSARRWNGQAAQVAIGVASASTTGSQPSNRSGGSIDTPTTGTPRRAVTTRRGP
jgi:hypothetical protein